MGFDLDLIAQRVMKLAEIATLEHLEALMGSQAGALMEMAEDAGIAHAGMPEYGFPRSSV